ncbi:hypothetical protein [Hymenobacter psychrophilus]|uniref:Uncharacterized protein n=1 Tax=Hymenobacter psychrophilus TaxID=651662 RepID=A0A1H3B9J4_9BACT|nr:hypothetical protein [Hymenobacter psychrophilus]SDX37699.1 hypothetical protein SAMN04488069_101181 [Hymenobacter psychrophilus]
MPPSVSATTTNPPLYSQRIIRLFSLAFSAVAGGVLTASNLRAVGRPEEARKALWASVAYTVVMAVLISLVPDSSAYGAYAVGTGLAGGYGLNSYADKFIPNKRDFPARSVWRPLAICLLISAPVVASLIYAL